jgi:hypothetical protein
MQRVIVPLHRRGVILRRTFSAFTRPVSLVSAAVAAAFGLFSILPLFAQQRAAGGGQSQGPPDMAAFLRRYQPGPVDFEDHKGWVQIFDGKTLDGWNGNPEIWHVADGAITAWRSKDLGYSKFLTAISG